MLLAFGGSVQADDIPASEKKVIEYLLEQEKKSLSSEEVGVSKKTEDDSLPQSLQKDIQRDAKPIATKVQQFPELGKPWFWGILLVLLILGAINWIIPKKKEGIGNLRIQSRSFFGQEGSLAVVEVQDAKNNARLFLIGLHSKGSPQFLADLSAPIPFPELSTEKPQIIQSRLAKSTKKQPENPKEKKEKEDLVEQVLRMREKKVVDEPTIPSRMTKTKSSQKLSTTDPWTEGFNEVFRK